MDVVKHEPAGASHCFDVVKNDRVLSRATPRFFALEGGHRGVVNRDGEVLERAGLP